MDYRCKNKLPHDYKPFYENPDLKVELCTICKDEIRFKKDSQGRIDNNAYLESHVRNFCQPFGPTAKLYYTLYHPELYQENKNRWTLNVCTNGECNLKGACNHVDLTPSVTIGDITQKGTNANE